MSVFVKGIQVIILVATICCASTFANERSSALSLAVEADSGDTAGDQVAFESEWDNRALPLLLRSRQASQVAIQSRPRQILHQFGRGQRRPCSAQRRRSGWTFSPVFSPKKRRSRRAVPPIVLVLRRRGVFCRSLNMPGNAKAALCWAISIARST